MIYTVSFDVEVESREQLAGGWFEIHDPPGTGSFGGRYRISFGGTQEQRDRAPRILAKRVRRKRETSNQDRDPASEPLDGENLVARVQQAQHLLDKGDEVEIVAWMLGRSVEDVRRVVGSPASRGDE